MARGSRPKVVIMGLVERVAKMHIDQNMTFTDIALVLQDEGYDVSRSGVHRAYHRNKKLIDEQRALESAFKDFVKEIKDKPNTDVSEINLQVLQRKAFAALSDVEFEDLAESDPAKLVNLVARLADSQVNLDRLKIAFREGVDVAKKEIEAELTKVLKDKDPDLLLSLIKIIQQMKVKDQYKKRVRR